MIAQAELPAKFRAHVVVAVRDTEIVAIFSLRRPVHARAGEEPLLACQVAPNISVFCSGRFDVTGGMLPSVAANAVPGDTVRVTTSLLKISRTTQ